VGTVCCVVLGAIIGFLVGVKMYHNSQFESNMKMFKVLIKSRKQSIKGKTKAPLEELLKQSFAQKLYSQEAETLKQQIQEGTMSIVVDAEEKILDEEVKYRERKGRKWITMLIGAVVLGVLGYFLMPSIYQLTKSSYDRSGIEKICDEMFGNVRIQDALTPEVNIVAYEYNKQ
jgi:uncharacterized membrane protein YraQ (UPF0718 family)